MGDQHAGPLMMEIAAAKALQWNVDFDRGLRSIKPGTDANFGVRFAGAQCEAVMKLGPQLVRWSQNCMVTASSANLFKLEAGQDRVFANAILLRLADTFRTGNNFIRACILKVLMLEFKERGRSGETFSADRSERAMINKRLVPRNGGSRSRAIRMSRSEEGLLTKKRIASHVEMLRRVKSVIDSGDPTSRALALRALGCLADLGKDSVDVHNLVLQAVQSPHHQEVSAAFFAMGCLSEISDEFAEQALEKAFEMINAMETPPQMKVWAVRFFSKLGHSPILSLQAHEMGRRIVLRYPTGEIVTTMLIALTLLAAESVVIMKSQVELLMNYLGSDPRMNVRAVALRSLGKLVSQAVHSTSIANEIFTQVFAVVQDIALPSTLHILALQVIRKLFRHCVTSLDPASLQQVMAWTELSAMRGVWPVVSQALSLLVEVAHNLTKFCDRIKYQHSELHDFSVRVCFLLCDQVSITPFLRTRTRETALDHNSNSVSLIVDEEASSSTEPKERASFLSVLLVKLMEGNVGLGWIIVDNIALLMESLAERRRQKKNSVKGDSSVMEVDNDTEGNVTDMSPEQKDGSGNTGREAARTSCTEDVLEIMLTELGRCLATCVSFQERQEKGVEDMHRRIHGLSESLIDACAPPSALCPVLEAFMKSTVLHNTVDSLTDTRAEKGPRIDRVGERRKTVSQGRKASVSKKSRDILYKLVSNFIQGCNGWIAYKLGEKAALCGLWQLADSCFSCLVEKASSEGCYFWLRALSDLCTGESLIQGDESQRYPESSNTAGVDFNRSRCGLSGDDGGAAQIDGGQEYARSDDLRQQGFGKAAASALPFLRSSINNLSAAVCLERMFDFQRWVLSLRLEMVECFAELVGLVASISSFDTDAGVIDLEDEGKDNSMKSLVSALRACTEKVELLGSRLKMLSEEYDLVTISFMGIDPKTVGILSKAALLCSLLTFCSLGVFSPQPTSFHPMPNSSINAGAAALDLYYRLQQVESGGWDDLLSFAINCGAGRGVIGNFATGPQEVALLKVSKWAVDSVLDMQKQLSLLGVVRGTRLLGQIIDEVLDLPWVSPPFFFCTRPRAGVELFLAQAGTSVGDSEDLSVAQGSTLALSVCLQIANAPVDSYSYSKKVICALSYQSAESAAPWDEGLYMGSRVGTPGSHCHHFGMVEKLISHSKSRNVVSSVELTMNQVQNNSQEQMGDGPDCFFSVTVDAKGQGFASCTVDVSGAPSGEYELFLSCLCFDKGNKEWILPLLNTRPRFRIT